MYGTIDKSDDHLPLKRSPTLPIKRIKRRQMARGVGTFVGAFLQLFVVDGLLDEVQDGECELRVRQGVCFGVGSGCLHV